MPFPALVLWGAAATVAAVGIKKGLDAKKDHESAQDLARIAKGKFEEACDSLKAEQVKLKQGLEELGRLKIATAQKAISYMVDMVAERKNHGLNASGVSAGSFSGVSEIFTPHFTVDELRECKFMLNVLETINWGVVTNPNTKDAVLTYGALGSSGLLGSQNAEIADYKANHNADISFAENDTLTWLKGDSVVAGGLGLAAGLMGSGIVILGGVVAPSFLAVSGFVLANKAEKELESAQEYSAEVDLALVEIDEIKSRLSNISQAKNELYTTIESLNHEFNQSRVGADASNTDFAYMLLVGKKLKDALNTPVMTKEGLAVPNLKEICDALLAQVTDD